MVLICCINLIYTRITGNSTNHWCDRKWWYYLFIAADLYGDDGWRECYFLRPKIPEDFEEKEGRYAFLRLPLDFEFVSG